MGALCIDGWGALTPVGLAGTTTCAAIRAGVCRFQETNVTGVPTDSVVVGRVPASWRMRPSAREWLLNLATHGVRQCFGDDGPGSSRTALFVCPPEREREHPGMRELEDRALLVALERRLEVMFSPHSEVLDGGAAGVVDGLRRARSLLERGEIEQAVVGGMDSLVNPGDIRRLRAQGRLAEEGNPQGLVPSEGACFLRLSHSRENRRFAPLAMILGVGVGHETITVEHDDFSQGVGIRNALENASRDAQVCEAKLGFVCSTFNGERYAAWESMIARARYYRTRRERLPVIYPATSVGDVGSAAGALVVLVAAMGFARGYMPGDVGMCETSGEGGLRGACVVAAGSPEGSAYR